MTDGMDETVYRCVNAQCGRLMPRRVNFCPWCGTAQGAVQPAPAAAPVLALFHAAVGSVLSWW